MSINRATLLGRLTKDVELKYGASGNAYASFGLATSESWTKDGEKQEKVEFHNIKVFGKLAELCSQYIGKGRQIFLEGQIQYDSYEKDGQKKYITNIVARNIQFLGGKSEKSQAVKTVDAAAMHDEIPF